MEVKERSDYVDVDMEMLRDDIAMATEAAALDVQRSGCAIITPEAWIYPSSVLMPLLREAEKEEMREAGDEEGEAIVRAEYQRRYRECTLHPYALTVEDPMAGLKVTGYDSIAAAVTAVW